MSSPPTINWLVIYLGFFECNQACNFPYSIDDKDIPNYIIISHNFLVSSFDINDTNTQRASFCPLLQVNHCQKLSFLHQPTHNMMTDFSLNYKFNTWKFQAQTWGEHVVYKFFSECQKQFLYTTCWGLSLEFSCVELVIQWTFCHHIVGWLMQK